MNSPFLSFLFINNQIGFVSNNFNLLKIHQNYHKNVTLNCLQILIFYILLMLLLPRLIRSATLSSVSAGQNQKPGGRKHGGHTVTSDIVSPRGPLHSDSVKQTTLIPLYWSSLLDHDLNVSIYNITVLSLMQKYTYNKYLHIKMSILNKYHSENLHFISHKFVYW